jgi:hypothetical protein
MRRQQKLRSIVENLDFLQRQEAGAYFVGAAHPVESFKPAASPADPAS